MTSHRRMDIKKCKVNRTIIVFLNFMEDARRAVSLCPAPAAACLGSRACQPRASLKQSGERSGRLPHKTRSQFEAVLVPQINRYMT